MASREPRHIDALVAEIGSTTTVVSAFDGLDPHGPDASRPASAGPRLLGQGFAPTSVAQGDVGIGVEAARDALEAATGPLAPAITLATSSAAGGLRMTVHGPLILLAGGVEGGDTEVILHNAERLTRIAARPIVVYGGNSAVAGEATRILEAAGFRVRVTRNVYPGVDELDIVPARHVIHDAFEEHITHAPGMERITEFVTGSILPTPGAVLIAAEVLAASVGDLVVIDVGGATTDVHSVTEGSPEIAAISMDPQPHAKRTVEGDLGTFVSARHVAALLPASQRPDPLPPAIPTSPAEVAGAATLARVAAITAVERHAGQLAHLYTPKGRQTVARGRDLTACRLLVGTGGALTRLPGGEAILEATRATAAGTERLLPPTDARVALDRDYVIAACGALSRHFPVEAVVTLMRESLGV